MQIHGTLRRAYNRLTANCRHPLALMLVLAMIGSIERTLAADAPKPPDINARKEYQGVAKRAVEAKLYPVAEKNFLAAWEASEGLGPKDQRYLESLKDLANFYAEIGKAAKAEPLYRKELEAAQANHREKYVEGGEAMSDLGLVLFHEGKDAEAESLLAGARDILARQTGAFSFRVAVCLYDLARVYSAQGRFADAETALQKTIRIFENPGTMVKVKAPDAGHYGFQVSGTRYLPNYETVAEARLALARVYLQSGKLDKAEAACNEAIKQIGKYLGKESPSIARAQVLLAGIKIRQANYPEAEALLKQSLTLLGNSLGPGNIQLAGGLQGMAAMYLAQQKLADADLYLQRTLDLVKGGGPTHPRSSKMYSLLVFYADSGRRDEAEELLKLVLDAESKILEDKPLEFAMYLINGADACREWSNHSEAAGLYQRALVIADKNADPHDTALVPFLEHYAKTLKTLGRRTDATAVEARITTINSAGK